MALHLTHVTKNLKIGCGFNVRPCGTRCAWLRTTRWQTSCRMAASCSASAVATIRARSRHRSPLLDQEANRELFEEQVEIIFKAFNQRSSSATRQALHAAARSAVSRLYLKELTLVPRPERLPVECWQPIQGGHAARARLHGEARILAWWAVARLKVAHAQVMVTWQQDPTHERQTDRTRRAHGSRLPFLHGRQHGAGHEKAAKYLRREHEDVRRIASEKAIPMSRSRPCAIRSARWGRSCRASKMQ